MGHECARACCKGTYPRLKEQLLRKRGEKALKMAAERGGHDGNVQHLHAAVH